jgi:hypothetical protein
MIIEPIWIRDRINCKRVTQLAVQDYVGPSKVDEPHQGLNTGPQVAYRARALKNDLG